jgi:RNA polymerase sigma-70 factor, ECF subfamily
VVRSPAKVVRKPYNLVFSECWSDLASQVTAWLRLSRADTDDVINLAAWLTTVTGRICLDMLRSRTARREEPLDVCLPDPVISYDGETDPEHEALTADAVGLALLVVLERLTPAERLAFVQHDLFGVPFSEIGPIVGRTPDAAKMLASRARRRVRSGSAESDSDPRRQREIVDAFRAGDFDALVGLLDPDVVLRADMGAAAPADLIAHGKIVAIDVLADPERLSRLDSVAG